MTEPKLYGVYLISNSVDKRVYVGSTAVSFEKRWRTHQYTLNSNSHHNSKLQNFYNKYGKDSIAFAPLESHKQSMPIQRRIKSVQRSEQIWLNSLKPFGDNGFNIQVNSGGGRKGKEIIAISFTDKKEREFFSITHAAESIGCHRELIHKVLSGKTHRYKDYTFFYKEEPPKCIKSLLDSSNYRKWPTVAIEALDVCTGSRKRFNSIKSAGEVLGICKENIAAVVRGTRERAGGYTFKRLL